MIHITNGIYQPWPAEVGRVGGGKNIPPPATFSRLGAPTEMLDADPDRVTTISHMANRSVSYQMALKNLGDVTSYLEELG